MLGRVYIKDKKVHLIYEGNIITDVTGSIYDVGHHLTGFTWFDMEFIKMEYVKFIKFIIDGLYFTEHDNPQNFLNKLSLYANEIDKMSPYLHFYTQALYDFMLVYGQNRAAAFHKLIYSATDCIEAIDKVTADITEECEMKYIKDGGARKHKEYYECDTVEEITHGAMIALSLILEDIEKKRERLNLEFDYITSENDNLQGTSAMQRLFLLDLKRKSNGEQTYYTDQTTDQTLKSTFMPTLPALWSEKNFEKAKDKLIDGNIEIVQMYEVFILDDLIRFELFHIITEQLLFKKCKYCGHYFVPIGRSDIEYCDRVYTGETKPCSQVGAIKLYESSKANDEIYIAYKKAYRRMHSRTRTKKLSKTDFLEWSDQATKKRDECYNGIITFEEFMGWLG